MSRNRQTKGIVFHLFDICEDGVHVGLNNVVQLERYNDSPNMSIQSRLSTCRKSVCVSTVLREVFV